MSNAIDTEPVIEAGGIIPVFNPSTEEQIAEVPDSDRAAVDAAVARARETFESGVWRRLPAAALRGFAKGLPVPATAPEARRAAKSACDM